MDSFYSVFAPIFNNLHAGKKNLEKPIPTSHPKIRIFYY